MLLGVKETLKKRKSTIAIVVSIFLMIIIPKIFNSLKLNYKLFLIGCLVLCIVELYREVL
jgi:hypothetical protein